MPKNRVLISLLLLFSLLGCATNRETFKPTAEELFKRAESAYAKKNYSRAITILERLCNEYSKSTYYPGALLLMGKSYIMIKDYPRAQSKLSEVVENYPSTPFAEEASYLIAKSYLLDSPRPELDQENTYKAISAFEDFLSIYPNSQYADSARSGLKKAREKLSHKMYLTAQLYYKMKDYEAALVYIDKFLADYSDSSYLCEIIFLRGLVMKAKGDIDAARADFERVVKEYPSTKIAGKAKKELARLR